MNLCFRFVSDLHLEFHKSTDSVFEIPAGDTDANTVLVLAGDIAVAAKPHSFDRFIPKCAEQFRHVIWIMGNHEHWDGSVFRSFEKIRRVIGDIDNVSIVENEVVRIDDVDFICATLWTDLAKSNPIAEMQVQLTMNDYKKIRTCLQPTGGGNPYARKLSASDTVMWHKQSLRFIENALVSSDARKKIVVTHHAPSWESVPERFKSDPVSCAYASPLDEMIMALKPTAWVHGHIHDSQDYNIGDTNILANPRGYFDVELNREFDPTWTIDLS